MTLQEAGPIIAGVGVLLTLGWNIYQATVGRQKADAAQDITLAELRRDIEVLKSRLTTMDEVALETERLKLKMGLFWRLVEDNMADIIAKANPISLTPQEKAAAHVYKVYKATSPTKILKTLDQAITREMPNLDPDERPGFTLIQSAIKAQLVDRHEYP